MGRDNAYLNDSLKYISVSIHAPAWGATHIPLLFAHVLDCFNPRARMGRDAIELTGLLSG